MENNEEKITKINFFKKIWYSIAKPNKYEDMKKEGVGTTIKYFFSLIAIVAIILAIIETVLLTSIMKNSISYLDEKLPEIKFKDNQLTIEGKEAVILDEAEITEYLKNVIVINPFLEKEKAIEEYKNLATDQNNVIVFLNDQYIIITSKYNLKSDKEEGLEVHNYSDVSSRYISDTSKEYTKQDLIEYLKGAIPFTYYVSRIFASYLLSLALIYIIYIAIISISLWLITKISKFKWTFKNSLMNTIYSSTLSILVYMLYIIINYFIRSPISFMDIISIFLIFIYIFILLWKDKNKNLCN